MHTLPNQGLMCIISPGKLEYWEEWLAGRVEDYVYGQGDDGCGVFNRKRKANNSDMICINAVLWVYYFWHIFYTHVQWWKSINEVGFILWILRFLQLWVRLVFNYFNLWIQHSRLFSMCTEETLLNGLISSIFRWQIGIFRCNRYFRGV